MNSTKRVIRGTIKNSIFPKTCVTALGRNSQRRRKVRLCIRCRRDRTPDRNITEKSALHTQNMAYERNNPSPNAAISLACIWYLSQPMSTSPPAHSPISPSLTTLSQAPLYVINPSLPPSQPLSQFHFMKHSSPQSLYSRHKNKQASPKSQSHVARWKKLPEVREGGCYNAPVSPGGVRLISGTAHIYIHEVRWLDDMDPGRIRGVMHGLRTIVGG